ncbi:MAG: RNA methyltransferase [Bdellovibrionaceae bacterium]|nr:RNA methyltransferase [Pseudobdellovibrionaceae bacterium]
MPRFIALSPSGLENALAGELNQHGAKVKNIRRSQVEFDANWEVLQNLHYWCRTASRFLKPVLEFSAYNTDDVYFNLSKKQDFTKFIDPSQSLRVIVKGKSKIFRDTRIVGLKVKDAIVDQFREKYGRRPDVDRDQPDLAILIRLNNEKISVALDLTGMTLSHRGYRTEAGEAPLRENLAAGLLMLAGWQNTQNLVDPFCGSGTILIEALRMVSGEPNHSLDTLFAFQTYKHLELPKVKPHHMAVIERHENLGVVGIDRDPEMIEIAKANAKRAGVADKIQWIAKDFRQVKQVWQDAVIVTNPPYGERLEQVEKLKPVFADFGRWVKDSFKDSNLWLLSGHPELSKSLRLKSQARYPVYNGPIECKYLNYPVG